MEVQLHPQTISIREVTVRAPKIQMKGDTIQYNVASFAEAQDRNLGDVLKKMPGIDVGKSGEIKYNGKPINKLYIEGTDMLGGKYGLATNNIPPKDVKSVEVLENHQPTKALKDIVYSDEAAINIKLQEGAKAQWIGTMDVSTGVGGRLFEKGSSGDPLLWDGNLFAMRIGTKWQNMNTFKTNNTGSNIQNELTTFNYADMMYDNNAYALRDFISVGVSNAPLAEERVRMNRSHLFNSTHLFKLSDDYQLTGQASYFREQLSSANNAQTTYFLGDNTLTVTEGEQALSQRQTVSAHVDLMANTEQFYLMNSLSAQGTWYNADVSMIGSYPNTQSAALGAMNVSNDFKFTKRIGNHSFTITSFNQYLRQPQHLLVTHDQGVSQNQDILQSAGYSNTSTSYGLSFGKGWSLTLQGGVKALKRALETTLSGLENNALLRNQVQLTHANLYLRPTLSFKTAFFTATLRLPVGYLYYAFEDIPTNGVTHNDFIINPQLTLHYAVSPKLTLTGSASAGNNAVDEQLFHSGLIMTNYRSLRQGLVNFDNSVAQSFSAGFEFKDPINNYFCNGSVVRSWNTSPRLSSQTFSGSHIVNTYTPCLNGSDQW